MSTPVRTSLWHQSDWTHLHFHVTVVMTDEHPRVSAEKKCQHQATKYSVPDVYHKPTTCNPVSSQNHVTSVFLNGVHIVALTIDGKERLCLAQISTTLLKNYSYNEIHNRRVALGITCVQCTPVQLEILRRAGAMPISSRRCGMISKREAERLVKSFLEDTCPPKLPESFCFDVMHHCGWGATGKFMPSRYNSSRAKCIKCDICNLYFSPNKFIFHYHRMPESNYQHPDAANFNSWRRHLFLRNPETEDIVHAWEDVKAMFNGGSRKRLINHLHSKVASSSKIGRKDLGEQPTLSPYYPSVFPSQAYQFRPMSPSFLGFPINKPTSPSNMKPTNWPSPNSDFNTHDILWPKHAEQLKGPTRPSSPDSRNSYLLADCQNTTRSGDQGDKYISAFTTIAQNYQVENNADVIDVVDEEDDSDIDIMDETPTIEDVHESIEVKEKTMQKSSMAHESSSNNPPDHDSEVTSSSVADKKGQHVNIINGIAKVSFAFY